MQKVVIEVKDLYLDNVLSMLHSLEGIMIDKIDISKDTTRETELELMRLQAHSMEKSWDNEEDKVWDEL